MFNAIWDRQQTDINGVISYVQARMNRVMTILKAMPLISGSAADIFKRYESN